LLQTVGDIIAATMNTLPPRFNLLDYFLGDKRLADIGSQVAIEFRQRKFTYAQLREQVDSWTAELLAEGIVAGDRVAMLVYDSPEFIACFLAAVSIGAIVVPINTYLSKEEVHFILADAGCRLLVAEEELVAKFAPQNTSVA
jgi:acyl-coenzyme A synthetase/AMP-(fatty) acid ligase